MLDWRLFWGVDVGLVGREWMEMGFGIGVFFSLLDKKWWSVGLFLRFWVGEWGRIVQKLLQS